MKPQTMLKVGRLVAEGKTPPVLAILQSRAYWSKLTVTYKSLEGNFLSGCFPGKSVSSSKTRKVSLIIVR